MIKKVEVIGLPGQGKSTLVGNYFKNSKKQKEGFLFSGFFYLPIYLFFWIKVLFSGKFNTISFKKHLKIILKRGLDSFVSGKRVVDEGSLQNFLSFFEYFDSIEKIKRSIKFIRLPETVFVIAIKDKETSIRKSSSRLEKRRGIEKSIADGVSFKMGEVLNNLILVLKESGVEVVYFDSFNIEESIKFNVFLNEKNN